MGKFGGTKDFMRMTQDQIKKKNKIKVKTKKVFLSLKSVSTSVLPDAEKIRLIVKHYKKSALALQALNDTKLFFTNCASPYQYLPQVFQEIFELLFDEEIETRNKLKETLKFLFLKFDAAPLLSCLSTVVTCVCGGLSHLVKVSWSSRSKCLLTVLSIRTSDLQLLRFLA
jgi:hypothetical protein